jgi:membrane protease YdiL (CAAX protease family)
MTSNTTSASRSPLKVFFVLAFGITWLGWVPGLLLANQNGWMMPSFSNYAEFIDTGIQSPEHQWLSIAFSLAVYGPLIGTLAATAMEGGSGGLKNLWQRITKLNIECRWYLYAIGMVLAFVLVPLLIFGLAGGFNPIGYALPYIGLVILVQLFTSGLGEEPGWRGYLLPRLQANVDHTNEKKRYSYIWTLGLIWAIWHYPITALQTLGMMQDFTVPQIVITIIISLAGQTMSIIGISYLYVWLYNNTQSVFLMMVFHALANVFTIWALSFLVQPQSAGLIIALMPWAIVLVLERVLGKENFPGPAPTFNKFH